MRRKPQRKMRCSDVTKYICMNLDEQLNSRKCRAIRKHLESCPTCPKDLAHLKKIIALYQKEPVPVVTTVMEKKLFAVLKLES